MSGIPEFNYPAFRAAARQLRGLGYAVVDPSETVAGEGWEWLDYMRAAIPQVLLCNAVALLPGWEGSRGARAERDLAVALGYDVRRAAEWGVVQ